MEIWKDKKTLTTKKQDVWTYTWAVESLGTAFATTSWTLPWIFQTNFTIFLNRCFSHILFMVSLSMQQFCNILRFTWKCLLSLYVRVLYKLIRITFTALQNHVWNAKKTPIRLFNVFSKVTGETCSENKLKTFTL